MSSNAQDEYFDEYNKPGAERSRRRRGTDDDIESDLEEELLEDDWAPGKKNPSELSDEELNDDLLQSDDEDVNMGGQHVSLNATYSLNTSYEHHDSLQEDEYTGDVGDDGYQQGEYAEDYGQDAEVPEDPMEYNEELGQEEEGYQDGVLDIQINEPLDGEFQDSEYQSSYNDEPLHEDAVQQEEAPEEVGLGGEQQEEEEAADSSQVFNTEVETEEAKEESDEEDDDTEESGRLRFKSERKESVGVRLADAGSKRRNIPETLELSEKAKQDLKEFEEQERQRRQNRYGGRGGGRGGGGGGGGRGGRGRGGFGMSDFRGGHRGRMNDYRVPLMGNMGLQPSSRIPPHQSHQQQLQSQQHHPSRPRGPPPPFQEVGRPLVQQSLQPLIPPHMAHRSSPLRQMEPQPPRMMSPQPPSFSQHRQQPPQPKNIHINPHFRGPSSSSVQVPLMPPAQSQPRPAVGPQRFPGPGDFQQHMPDNFGQAQRPPHHIEPFRNHPPHGPQDRNPHFMPEHTDSPRFPGPHMFDHPSPLLNNNNNSVHQQLSGPGHMSFGPPGPAFNQSNQGPAGLFSRDPPRPNHPPHQGHQGMVGMNQQGGPPNQPRPCLGPRQPFGQQGALFPPPSVQFGMQVRLRGLMPGPPVSQLPHHDSLSSHQPLHQHQHQHHQQQQQHQHHRQELPHHHHLPHQQQQRNLVEPRPMMHHGQHPFHQQQGHGGPRPMTPRPQNPQQRNMSNKQRMNTPVSKQMQLRNSNLRELPVAPGNMSVNSAQPISSPTPSVRPVARATQGARPGQNIQPAPNHGRGRGQVPANTESQPGAAGRAVVHKEVPSTASAKTQEDPDEDEETRQYRLKIEEQKRLREEILKRKEQRRQMQAGARKKELMERLNSLAPNTQSEGPTPPTLPTQHNLQTANPVQQQQAAAAAPRQQQLQPQPQRPFPQRPQQSSSQCLKTPNQDPAVHPNGAAPQPNVKTHLQLPKGGGGGGGGGPQTQTPGLLPNQQWKQPQQNQPPEQRGISAAQNVNRPGAQVQKNIPVLPSSGPGLAGPLGHGPQPGAKRTVMQRAKNPDAEGQQVPQKVLRVSGAGGKGPEVTAAPLQQQGNCPTTALNQRKVTMTGQKPQGAGRPPQAGPQQNRVVVTGRGRGGGPMGRGRTVPTRQSPRVAESQRSTVSIEGLSLSTTETQLRNLLRSIGPIEMFKMMPQQRKAVATFSNPDHAASFQLSFHRHMIDLSHIDVSLIDG